MRLASRKLGFTLGVAAALLSAVSPAGAGLWTEVALDIQQLFILNAGEGHYEGWLARDGVWYTLGKFNMDSGGTSMKSFPGDVPITFLAAPGNLTDADSMIITVEPENDPSALPNRSRILAGAFVAGSASLSVQDPRAIGRNFGPDSCKAAYHLDTPSDAVNGNWASGIWFYDHQANTKSMTLPTLPPGWKYEAWIGSTGSSDPIPYSCGEFYTPTGADSDGCGGGAGTGGSCPAYPGQDFLNPNPQPNHQGDPVLPILNGGGWGITISIEPDPNTGPNPFHSLEPLNLGTIPGTATQYTLRSVNNTVSLFPIVTATLSTAAAKPATWGDIKQLYR